MDDIDKLLKEMQTFHDRDFIKEGIMTINDRPSDRKRLIKKAIDAISEMRSKLYQYMFVEMLLGTYGMDWIKLLHEGKAEVVCKNDEHKRKTVITFRMR